MPAAVERSDVIRKTSYHVVPAPSLAWTASMLVLYDFRYQDLSIHYLMQTYSDLLLAGDVINDSYFRPQSLPHRTATNPVKKGLTTMLSTEQHQGILLYLQTQFQPLTYLNPVCVQKLVRK